MMSTTPRSGESVPWAPGLADIEESINQSILAVGLERNGEVDGGVSGRGTQILPVGEGDLPHVLHTWVTPL